MIIKSVLKNRFNLYYSSLLAIFFIIFMAYFSTVYIEKNIESKILNISTNDVFEITNNTAKEVKSIVLENKQDFDLLVNEGKVNSSMFFKLLDKKVELLKTKNIKYAYILYVDKNNIFRFISDASKGVEKASLNQKFDIDSKKWFEAYITKESKVIKHDYLDELSLTYLKPIELENQTIILAIDFSVKKIDEISSTISQIKLFLQLFWIFISILLVILIYQTFKFYKAKRVSYIDRLTGIYSRNYLQDNEMFLNLKEYIICAIDVDYFKKVNDTYGHIIGDDILVEITNTIKNEIREKKDIFIRYGGEEFCLLIKKESKNDEYPLKLLEKIHTTIKNKKFKISSSEEIPITISIGVNKSPNKQRNFVSAFKLADMALYNAKNKGRNTIEIYQEKYEDNDYLTINDIKDAIENNNVVVYYQEIVNENELDNKKYYEALIRIIKNGQIYLPEKFLPTIKNTFIATKLTKELLNIIYKELQNVDEPIQISINLTQQDLQNDAILNILNGFAKSSDIATKIALEIVETDEIISFENITKTIVSLKNLGYKIYIDDFGSGYSNFIYLSKINADAIKIDGSIISTINSDELSYLVAKNIMNFAKEANIDVIAEYVSSKEIYETVKSLGIKKFQGYYFSKPK